VAKIEVEFEITGMRLKVKAERDEDVSRVTQQLSRQLSGLTQPFAGMIESNKVIDAHAPPASDSNGETNVLPQSNVRTGRKRTRRTSENGGSQPIHWQHDAEVLGTPKQSWTAYQKILWIMYVISKETNQTEISGPVIAESFNRSFKQFGVLRKNNMPRDLGALKTKSPAQVMDNTTASPITWYLTDAGSQEAQKLVLEARGVPANNQSAG